MSETGSIEYDLDIDLSRMIERALPGQILLGDFRIETTEEKTRRKIRYDTLDFVENTAATLDQLHGMNISGGSIDNIRCYRENSEPIFLGIQSEDLQAFSTARVEALSRDAEHTGSFFVRP